MLINERDLFVKSGKNIIIIDTKNKKIIKDINLDLSGYLSYIYKLSENIILVGFWNKYIGQLEYDDIKKDLKLISNIGQNMLIQQNYMMLFQYLFLIIVKLSLHMMIVLKINH